MIYRLLGFVSLIIQIYFVVHAVRTGRDRWVFIILFLPGIGSLAYFFAEYLPDLRNNPKFDRSKSRIEKTLKKSRTLKQLEKKAEQIPSFQNRFILAGAYLASEQYKEAITIYEDLMKSPNTNKEGVLEGLSEAYYRLKKYDTSRDYLLQREEMRKDKRPDDYSVLLGMVYEEMGASDDALELYQSIMDKYLGEQARFRYGLLLKKSGEHEKAQSVFKKIIENTDISPKYYKRQEKVWLKLAKEELKSLSQ